MKSAKIVVAACIALLGASALPASAQTLQKLRVGKAISEAFTFTPLDIGLEEGIFKKHGIDLEIIDFTGDAKLQQAFAADAADMGLGSGPGLAFIVKGSPITGVAALANAPNTMTLIVSETSGIKTIADLKGRKIAVTTVGALTGWLLSELSRQQGWGPNGIQIIPLGGIQPELAAMKTGDVDGLSSELALGLRLEDEKTAHILVRFGEIVKDFHIQVIYATNKLIAQNPDAVRHFLAGWFETIAFMNAHKDAVVRIAAPIVRVSPEILGRSYDVVMPVVSKDGKFNPKALETLSQSFVALGTLPTEPDMSKLVTEAYLPGK